MLELVTPFVIVPLFYLYPLYQAVAYVIFFSALLINIRTDLESMLLLHATTIYLAPLGWVFSLFKLLPISAFESLLGALVGYGILWACRTAFFVLRKHEGLGLGDLELMALIGAFTGPIGAWMSILIGSTLGSIVGLILLKFKKISKDQPFPFGPFLACGAFLWVLLKNQIIMLLIF